MPNNDKIEKECLDSVRKAIAKVTSGDLYDYKGYLTKEGYEALEELEGLDLFWICDPLIQFRKQDKENDNGNNS